MENIIGKNAIETITSLTSIPMIDSAYLSTNTVNVNGTPMTTLDITYITKCKDQVKNKVRTFKKNVSGLMNGKDFVPVSSLFSEELNESIVETCPSPSGTKTVVLRSLTTNDNKKEYIIELYNKDRLINDYNVTDYHGNYYMDGHFWSLSWSKDENKIAYIAEEKKTEEEKKGYKTYAYEEDWGEKNDKKLKPQVVVLDLITKNVTVIHTESSAGHVSITTDNKLVFVQFPDKIKYGMIYCVNRYSTAWQCNIDGSNMECIINQQTPYEKLPLITSNPTPVDNVRGLRYDSEGHALYFLSNPVTNFPHGSCSRLFKYDLSTKTLILIVDYVNEVSEKYGDALIQGFPGIFSHQLPHHCCQHFITEGLKKESFIFLKSTWGTRQTIMAVQESTGTIIDLTADKLKENWKIIYVSSNYILADVSTPSQPSCLMLGKIIINGGINIQWTPITSTDYGEDNNAILNNICSMSKTLKNPTTGGEFDIIVLYPKKLPSYLKKSPLIINPHGGPHSSSTFDFSTISAGLVSFGYTITLINYTGSLGYGQKKVLELVGKIGELDISDCYTAAEAVKQMTLDTVTIDTEKVFYNGGSHGGFIGAHMISKYPNYFKACCLRNPVINCGGMLLTSDIPEWSPLELGIQWDMHQPPVITDELYQKAFNCSPVKNVDRVVTPLLLLLGEMDRRVPRQDSFIYARLLKSKNKDVEVVLFPGTGHALDSVEAEKYSFESIVLKFSKYLK